MDSDARAANLLQWSQRPSMNSRAVNDVLMEPQPAHILVVDDEASIRLTLEALLRRSGHMVTLAATG